MNEPWRELIPKVKLSNYKYVAPKAPVDQTCGNCKHIKYSGINEIKMISGQCSRYKETGVLCVMSKQSASDCPYWHQRGRYKMVGEQVNQEIMVERLGGIKGRR